MYLTVLLEDLSEFEGYRCAQVWCVDRMIRDSNITVPEDIVLAICNYIDAPVTLHQCGPLQSSNLESRGRNILIETYFDYTINWAFLKSIPVFGVHPTCDIHFFGSPGIRDIGINSTTSNFGLGITVPLTLNSIVNTLKILGKDKVSPDLAFELSVAFDPEAKVSYDLRGFNVLYGILKKPIYGPVTNNSCQKPDQVITFRADQSVRSPQNGIKDNKKNSLAVIDMMIYYNKNRDLVFSKQIVGDTQCVKTPVNFLQQVRVKDLQLGEWECKFAFIVDSSVLLHYYDVIVSYGFSHIDEIYKKRAKVGYIQGDKPIVTTVFDEYVEAYGQDGFKRLVYGYGPTQ